MAERLIQKEQAHGLCQGTVEMGLGTISSLQLVILGGKGAFAQLSNCTSANQGLGAFSLPMEIMMWSTKQIYYNFVSSREGYCEVCVAAGWIF